jgi:membrane protease YdiL (CAAX protease family)
MSEVRALGGAAIVSILISVGLQTSYHLYQGLPNVPSLAVSFLIYSIYYSRYGRISPVILAHLYVDAFALLHSLHR